MEPDQRLLLESDEQEKLPTTTTNVEIKETEIIVETPEVKVETENDKTIQTVKECVEPAMPSEASEKEAESNGNEDKKNEPSSEKSDDVSCEKKNDSISVNEGKPETDKSSSSDSEVKEKVLVMVDEKDKLAEVPMEPEIPPEDVKPDEKKSQLPTFPGTVTKSVPGSNDVKIEIDSNSLLDRVILYSLKNTVVDNSRLDAAKNKYNMLYNGNRSSSFSVNSNGSDSNLSSKSEGKSDAESKVEKSEVKSEDSQSNSTDNKQKSDTSIESSNGADAGNNKSQLGMGLKIERSSSSDVSKTEDNSSPDSEKNLVESSEAVKRSDSEQTIVNDKPSLAVAHKSSSENEALDFRDIKSDNNVRNQDLKEKSPEMLDLTVPHRDDKSVPPIKRNLALYVGLPNFSKQIFTEPSINKSVIKIEHEKAVKDLSPPKTRNPDFSVTPRSAPELQIRHLDFSKSFTMPEVSTPQVTPSNFPEIVRKNNYISDLQLKPSSSQSPSQVLSATMPSSYKIEYPSSEAISQQLQNPKVESRPDNYPYMKKENVTSQSHQSIDEPKAHIIHKNQFVPCKSELPSTRPWNERQQDFRDFKSHPHNMEHIEGASYPTAAPQQNPNCDIQKSYSPYSNQQSQMPREFKKFSDDTKEEQLSHEFSLKRKEQQLRQEGTIITIKHEQTERSRSTDLFRDYKLKQPKESPGAERRVVENPGGYQQPYPVDPLKQRNQKLRVETIVKPARDSPDLQAPERPQLVNNSYHGPSPPSFNNPLRNPQMYSQEHQPMNSRESWHISNLPQPSNSRDVSLQPAKQSNMVFAAKPNPYYPSSAPNSYGSYTQPYQNSGPTPPMVVNVNQTYQPYKTSTAHDVKEIPNRNYQQPTSSQSTHNYYHPKFPDFTQRFDLEKRHLPKDQSMRYPSQSHATRSHDFRGYAPPQEVHSKIAMVPSRPEAPQQFIPNGYDPEAASRHAYSMRLPEPMRQEAPVRVSNSEPYDSSRRQPLLNYERRSEEPQHLRPVTSEAVRRPDIIELPARIKVEPTSAPVSEAPIKLSVIKPSSSVFVEVKRESPLDLSVKTVKTKADSTGSEQDFSTRRGVGLKVEFKPNFATVASLENHENSRSRAQDNEADRHRQRNSSSERFHYAQPVPHDQKARPVPVTSQINHQQYQQVTSNRSYIKETQMPIAKQPPPPPVQMRNHYAEKVRYDALPQQSTSQPPYPLHYPKDAPRHDDKSRIPNQRSNHQLQPHEISNPPTFPERVPQPAYAEHQRHPNTNPNPRDPLYYERERDRKYVEEILYRHRKEPTMPVVVNKHHPNAPMPPQPRKRIVENQHIYSAAHPKQRKIEEVPAMAQTLVQSNFVSQQNVLAHPFEPRPIDKHEHFSRSLPAIGHPPALIKHKHYQEALQTRDPSQKFIEAPIQNNAPTVAYSPYSSPYPNPKAEMIHRNDSTSHFAKAQIPNQNFQKRPDDNALQLYQRIHHPIQEGGIKIEHQPAGLFSGTSGEAFRMTNGVIASNATSGVTAARGADHSTILKLKTNLELKEQKKLTLNNIERLDDHEQKKDLSPRQFRTKGELKGFIPLPPVSKESDAVSTGPIVAASSFDLLDWGSACNDFVQQLETGKKLTTSKKKQVAKIDDRKTEEKQLDIPGTTAQNLFDIPKDVMKAIVADEKKSSSDEDKPLLELVNSQASADNKSGTSSMTKNSDKVPRNMREKQRMQLEKRHAARLGDPSSSENETERPLRAAFKIRRLRKRSALGIKKSDEELSVEEEEESEEEEEEVTPKRCHTRSFSKLDELTSSDDDKKKGYGKGDDVKSSSSKKLKKSPANSTRKQESSSGSSSSDDATANKTSKTSPKGNKKSKRLDSSANIKSLLKEETMTRSKRKMEIEKELSNSKILRNEKVVQNVVPDKKTRNEPSVKKVNLKRKNSTKDETKRKSNGTDSDSNALKDGDAKTRRVSKLGSSSSGGDSEPEQSNKTERLRTRTPRRCSNTQLNSAIKSEAKAQQENKSLSTKASGPEMKLSLAAFKDDKTSKFTAGWEADTYNFKRSLKIPADPQTSDTSEIFSEFVKSKDKNNESKCVELNKMRATVAQSTPAKSRSIIDLLHQRVIQRAKRIKPRKAANNTSETAQATADDLLPTPEKESEKVFGFKKNIFETSIITSRTRTENNALRKKEILKEVFGADDDRPKSAPPAGAKEPVEDEEIEAKADAESETKISYDQKYREYLEKMNIDFLSKTADISKMEESKATDISVKDDEEDDDDNVTVSEKDMITPGFKIKGKRGRGRRCKGSSGFDYIRKKKKPTSNTCENPMSVNNIIKKRLAAMENLESKDENDISREIKGWVMNKGVGESVLHKASRLDYVDVIAFCLDRLNMNPDPKDNAGYTPLHEACSRGHLEIARILLQYGANHSETALSGIRPLHEAIENGYVEIVRLLISYGADPCLATYSGQLPIAMAEDEEMESFLNDYLIDIADKKGVSRSWYFEGPYKLEDATEDGFEVFNHMPLYKTELSSSIASVFSTSLTSLVTATTQMSDNDTVISESTATTKVATNSIKAPNQDLMKYQHKMKKCDTNSNNILLKNANSQESTKPDTLGKKIKGAVINQIESNLRKIKKLPALAKTEPSLPKPPEPIQKLDETSHKEDYDDIMIEVDSDTDILEVEESEAPLPPLYLLKDEGSDKWILLTDLCNLLKVKSKDAVLKQICPLSPPALNKELIRELKMSDFLEKAVCLQLFCAGEKLNVRASKVSLVRYNDSVRNLLGVQTIRMNL